MMMMIPPPHDHEYTELGIHKTIASNISTMRRRRSNPPTLQSTSSTVTTTTTTSCSSKNFDDSTSYSGPLQCRPREFEDSEPGRVSAGVKPSPISPPPSARPRSFNDASNPNAALHRALLAIKKQQQRMAATNNAAPSAVMVDDASHDHGHGSSITNPDARTLSMRERGRWGNSKMQQHMMFSPCASEGKPPSCDGIRVSADGIRVNSSSCVESGCGQYSRQQPLQHVRCLHCGSFSTTPVTGSHSHGSAAKNVGGGGGSMRGGGGGGGSHSFGRRSAVVRDYSWQQELYEKKAKADHPAAPPPPPAPAPPGPGPAPTHRFEAEGDGQFNGRLHHHCSAEEAQFSRYPDNSFQMGGSDHHTSFSGHLRFGHQHQHQHQHNPWTWQGRYMLLCQAIAAGAFMDEELSHMATAGYSCASCEWGGGGGGGFRRPGGATPGANERAGFGTTATSERMMELEAFSGPLGYVSESKGNAMLPGANTNMNMNMNMNRSYYAAAAAAEPALARRRRSGGGKWWSRISGLARSKSEEVEEEHHSHHHHQAAAAAQSSSTAQCAGCGQRLWVHDELSRGAATKRLCPDCLISSPASPMGYRSAAAAAAAEEGAEHEFRRRQGRRRPPPMRFAYKAAAAAAAAASGSSRPCPKRWRLMRLCRYLLGL